MKHAELSRSRTNAPSYSASLEAYQTAFRDELDRSVDLLPLTPTSRVLDVPCGNGFYTQFLAKRLTSPGRVDAVDLCRDYLGRTRQRLKGATSDWGVHESDAYDLPFRENTFDVVWCAQSLISLNDAFSAILEMKRVVRSGGTIAILENDVFHHVLLPWPVQLEIPIQRAIQQASRARFGSDVKLCPVRRLPKLFEDAGLKSFQRHTIVADRTAPWTVAVRKFLDCHLVDLKTLVRGRLSSKVNAEFQKFVDGRTRDSLFRDRSMDLTCLNALYCAIK